MAYKESKYVPIKIEGLAYYARLHSPKNKYQSDEKEFSLDLVIDEEKAKKLNSEFNVKMNSSKHVEGKFQIRPHQDAKFPSGDPRDPIPVFDAKIQKTDVLIGNGSRVKVSILVSPGSGARSAGVYLQAVQILELVPFEKQEQDFGFSEEKGFVSETKEVDDVSNLFEGGDF